LVGRDRVAAEPRAAAEVLRACAGLPLALRIAGARLESRPHWRIADLAERLADRGGRLDELAVGDQAVRAGLAVSVDALGGAPAARAFSLLGLWTGEDLALPAAGSLLGLGPRPAEAALDELVDAQLLQSPAPGRYRFHDLIRVYAAERAPAELSGETAAAAVARLVSWYAHAASRADLQLSPGRRIRIEPDPMAGLGPLPDFDTAAEAAQWCDAEHANLVDTVLLARAAGLHRLCWQLPLALWGYFHLRGHLADWIATYESALAAAQDEGDLAAQGMVRNQLAVALIRAGRIADATVQLEAAIEAHLANGNVLGAAAALNNLAIATMEDGRPDDAIGYLHRLIDQRRATNDLRGEAYAQSNLGEVYFRTDRVPQALERYRTSLALYRESGTGGEAVAQVLYNLALAYAASDEPELARARGAEAVALSREQADHRREAEVLEWLGGASLAAGDVAAAQEQWARAAFLLREEDPSAAERIEAEISALVGRP
jgi:tetratricopeptide (TPR) repeat protein